MPGRVWLFTDDRMDGHASAGHPERPERRLAAVDGVRDGAGDELVEASFDQPAESELAAIHRPAYLALLKDGSDRGGGWLDGDTYLGPSSYEVACLAAGATVAAARAAVAGEAAVAFAVVRPPGHHAAADHGSGFCILNNIAIAAAALRSDGVARRIAIVDWDVHHGDGTQDLFDADPDLLYASTHQSPFYPGTGSASERGSREAIGTKINRPLLAGDGDDAFVAAWVDELLPAVEAFAPEAVLVSAGYDAHAADPLAELSVTTEGFGAVAQALGRSVARIGLAGVALTLEGGYDLQALRAASAATVRGLLAGIDSG